MPIIRMPVSLFQINLKVMLTSYGRLCKNVGYCCYFIEVDQFAFSASHFSHLIVHYGNIAKSAGISQCNSF